MKMQKEANTKDVSKEKKEIFIHEKKKMFGLFTFSMKLKCKLNK